MKIAAACVLVLVTVQSPRVKPLREVLLFGALDEPSVEVITEPAAAARWKDVQTRAHFFLSRLRPSPEHSRLFHMVWGKRQSYERLFNAVATPASTGRDTDLWVAEEVADFVEGMRPCYEWEGGSWCPQKEAEFAEHWLKWNDRGALRDYLPVFASHRWTCAAEALEYEKKPADAAKARERSSKLLAQGLRSEDPLIRYVARQMEQDVRCHARP